MQLINLLTVMLKLLQKEESGSMFLNQEEQPLEMGRGDGGFLQRPLQRLFLMRSRLSCLLSFEGILLVECEICGLSCRLLQGIGHVGLLVEEDAYRRRLMSGHDLFAGGADGVLRFKVARIDIIK